MYLKSSFFYPENINRACSVHRKKLKAVKIYVLPAGNCIFPSQKSLLVLVEYIEKKRSISKIYVLSPVFLLKT